MFSIRNHITIFMPIICLHAGVFALFPCNTTAVQEGQLAILTELRFSAYTHDKEFDPIVLYFYKRCNYTSSPKGVTI